MSFDPRTPPVRSRLPQVGTTIFTVMSALAQQHGAVNLGQGFPTSRATRPCWTP
jgi:methionine aminotransferase